MSLANAEIYEKVTNVRLLDIYKTGEDVFEVMTIAASGAFPNIGVRVIPTEVLAGVIDVATLAEACGEYKGAVAVGCPIAAELREARERNCGLQDQGFEVYKIQGLDSPLYLLCGIACRMCRLEACPTKQRGLIYRYGGPVF